MASPAPLLLLRVKRKATETPVEAIEVTGGSAKRRKTASAVFRLKSEDKEMAATASPRKRKNVGPGCDAGGKEERKRFKVVQADGDAKVGPQLMCFFSLNIGHSRERLKLILEKFYIADTTSRYQI